MESNQADPIRMDALDPANSLNMPEMTDMTLATDFLVRAKEGVRNAAVALTEAVSPEARTLLKYQLKQGIQLHREIAELMVRKNWFHPYELEEQFKLDGLSAVNTVEIAKQKLFPDPANRKGMFDRTPDEPKGGPPA
ncbi:spore coat protein CotF [Cohnella thailandensis]|nr:spore coat protein [Cohnella thailandensis]MBP1977079.1 spore coat protein CotF [Cohnella thailandensis]